MINTAIKNQLHNALEQCLTKHINNKLIPGAVLSISYDNAILCEQAYGFSQLMYLDNSRFAIEKSYLDNIKAGIKPLANPVAMTIEHLFDLASLTKVLATTFAAMLLVDNGALNLDKPLSAYLNEFANSDKKALTIRQLLNHTAGLAPWAPLYYHANNPADAIKHIAKKPLHGRPGANYLYSDLGFIILGYLIEKITGAPLVVFLKKTLFSALGLTAVFSNPPRGNYKIAATSHGNPYEYKMVTDESFGYPCQVNLTKFSAWRNYTLNGEVNDGNAYHVFNGSAGHAGLFASAADVNTLIQLIVNRGCFKNKALLKSATIDAFINPADCLGWKILNDSLNPVLRNSILENKLIIGHSGFTGGFIFIAPELKLTFILLTNRQNLGVNADGSYNDLTKLREAIIKIIISNLFK